MSRASHGGDVYGDREFSLLLREFDEAWLHYRHLEESRSTHVRFIFTLLLATASFTTAILVRDGGPRLEGAPLFGLVVTLILLDVIATSMYLIVKKTGCGLDHYQKVITRIRSFIYSDPEKMNEQLWSGFGSSRCLDSCPCRGQPKG